jgi:hypothetical protein
MRSVSTVAIEAIVIGVMNLILIRTLVALKSGLPHGLEYVIVGAFIHILFEYTGANQFWCKSTYGGIDA